MAIVDHFNFMTLDMFDDPDDYRPNSKLALVVDPGDAENGQVKDMVVFREKIAPGDKIPIHKHTMGEILVLISGSLEVSLGKQRQNAGEGAVIFIPARVAHGFKNIGDAPAEIVAMFPTGEVDICYQERNPAPGTEGDLPGNPVAIDVLELTQGNPGKAVRPVDRDRFE